ncbi:putative TrbI protein [Legionella quinlivanii]|uniref:Putative TrbI protein n=1 Tax=Legionella quinlivanii TaxID=45073 RepID=A0A0W0XS51_9GAMM|nr:MULTISPECIES: TrbI F-type domain-containing protein [Legionella]KTD47445.1 putative TrbI protein [Legionella quinlivanii]MCE3043688.1 type-F conjugative transfer system protein TrbI [Legionella sp. 16cNR16C]SEG46460.1 conjugal transfer pilin signal peptidase TrbI [Legionella quinlivanii DSM 21216]STY49834.1 putative TrbI protein [Legionella quinlivanii]
MRFNSKYLLAVLTGAVLSGVLTWSHPKGAPIAIVDMQRVLNQPAVLLSQSHLSEKEQKTVLSHYSSLLPQVLSEFGESRHVTLIAATVIASGSLDVTDEVIAIALEKLKGS